MAQVLWSPFICDFWQNYMYRLLLWKLFHLPAGDNVIFFPNAILQTVHNYVLDDILDEWMILLNVKGTSHDFCWSAKPVNSFSGAMKDTYDSETHQITKAQ